MKWSGLISTFGGPDDKGMASDSGLTLYEPAEADRAEPLFIPAPPDVLTWKRLRIVSFYIALPFVGIAVGKYRRELQAADFRISANDRSLVARLVDRGPHYRTGRLVDMSPGLAIALGIRTDDRATVELLTPVEGFALDPRNRFTTLE